VTPHRRVGFFEGQSTKPAYGGARLAGNRPVSAGAAFFVDRDPLHLEGLPDMGEVQIVIERGGDPDVSDFEAAMPGAIQGGVIGFAVERVKIVGSLFKQFF
jgi:hypothetical protein